MIINQLKSLSDLFRKIVFLVLLTTVYTNSFSQKIKYSGSKMSTGGKGIIKLRGNVVLTQGSTTIYCDKADMRKSANSFTAYDNIKVLQGAQTIYSDNLVYTGNNRFGKFRNNVKLVDDQMTLTTDFLDFNGITNSGYFYNGGEVVDSSGTLRSKTGYYFPDESLYFFKDSVVVETEDYTIYSDTLKYNTEREIVYVFGPTEIIGDSNYIYCENGLYDMKNNRGQFSENAFLKNDRQYMEADSLYYDRNAQLGEGFGNVWLKDSLENMILNGNYARYREEPEFALITGNALFMQISSIDTMFMHADTIMSNFDTTGLYRQIHAFNKVKTFRYDLQMMCDSLVYSFADSVIYLYREPVIWSEEHQIFADKIEVHTKNNVTDYVILDKDAMIISQLDTSKFNQIRGKAMIGYIKENALYKIAVDGSGQTIYYAEDKDAIIGVNKAESSEIIIHLGDKKVEQIVFKDNPLCTLYPLSDLSDEEMKMKEFIWLDKHRPKNKNDIFIWLER